MPAATVRVLIPTHHLPPQAQALMPRPSPHRPLLPALASCLALLALALSACGDSSDSLTNVQGSSASITKPMLDHWMRALAGADFRSTIGTKGPRGLVSEPADEGECAEAAKKIVPRSFTGKLKLTGEQIKRKCQQLHDAVKAQALSFLLSVQWTVAEGAEQGLHVSDADLHREFARSRGALYPTEADLQKYLAERQWTLSDVLYQLKRAVLVTRILPKFQQRVKRAGGGEAVYAKLALERYQGLIAKTTCRAGYVVQGCKGYREPAREATPPNALLEQFAQGRGA
jgi:hypothetical protein